MVASLPSRIMNYRVLSSSPTDELLTIGRIFSEVGNYASTILDREHLAMARQCMNHLSKVVGELESRGSIEWVDDLDTMAQEVPVVPDLATLSIAELYDLYRSWPIRHKKREAEGREHFTFYYEGRIVRELGKRIALNKADQLKIDYCVATYHNELDNMSSVFSLPVQIDGEKPCSDDKVFADRSLCLDYKRGYAPDELTALICLYKDYQDITERELLVECVDFALDLLEKKNDTLSYLGLLSEIAEFGNGKVILIPEWVNKKLEESVEFAIATKRGKGTDLALAMLTLQLINKDAALERKAQRIINRCYKSAFDESGDLEERIENLHLAVMCCDYVSRFSVRKVAKLWNELSAQVLSSGQQLTPSHIFQLLEIAKECEGFADMDDQSKDGLRVVLEEMAQSDCKEARTLDKIVKLRF